MEVINKITHEGESNTELFNLVFTNLIELKTAKKLKQQRLTFITNLLVLMGYWPEKQVLDDPDTELEKVIERQIHSERVGKRMIQ